MRLSYATVADELVVIHRNVASLKCPITQATLVEPVRSTSCGHTYSRAAIENTIRRKRGGATCPIAGCNAALSLDSLERDVDAERALAKAQHGKKRKPVKAALDVVM